MWPVFYFYNHFALTTGLYWSYTLLLKSPVLTATYFSFTMLTQGSHFSYCWPGFSYPVRVVYNQDVPSIQQLIKGTNCTSPCPLPCTFLLTFLETNPCPTLYPTYPKQLRGRGIAHSQNPAQLFVGRRPEIEASEMVSDSAEVWGLVSVYGSFSHTESLGMRVWEWDYYQISLPATFPSLCRRQ